MLTITSDVVTIVGFLVSTLSLLLLILLKMIPRFLPRLLGVFFLNLIKKLCENGRNRPFFSCLALQQGHRCEELSFHATLEKIHHFPLGMMDFYIIFLFSFFCLLRSK